MAKIAIIRTPFVFPVSHYSSITAVPDIGTAYICGSLQEYGHDAFIIDAPGENIKKRTRIKDTELAFGGLSADEIIERIPEDTDIIGLQSMHSNRWIYDGFIVKKILKKFPNKKIILGGENVTATYEKILKQIPEVAACVIGEGEETAIELIDKLVKGESVNNVQGIAFVNESGQICMTGRRGRRTEINKIPRPSWTNVPIKNYLDNFCGVNSLSRRSITMIATRGCPYSCTFCTVPNMWESKWYPRDAADVVDEIKTYIRDFGVNHIDFVDLTIVINKKWMHKFCDLLIAENLDLTWAIPIGTRTEKIDLELLHKMKKSGLVRVLYSAESGSDDTLDRIKKNLDIKHFNKIVRQSSSIGIVVKVALIFGFPGQSLKEVFDSFLLVNKLAFLGARDIVCLSFIPYPKTELYDELDVDYDYSWVDNNIRLNNDVASMKSWSEHFGDRSLRFFIVFFMLYFYALQGLFRPHRVVSGFYRVFIDQKPLTNFESIIFNSFKKEKIAVNDVEDIRAI